MVNSRSAGICFTANPNTGDASKIAIEGSWGLGESVVGGIASPDRWTLDKETLEVVERSLGEKSMQVAFRERGVATEELPSEKRTAFCMSDDELRRIGELAKILESHFGVPQDIEWAIDSNTPFSENIFLLQTRPEVVVKKSAIDRLLDAIIRGG